MKWISVDERLPDDCEDKMVWVIPTQWGGEYNTGIRITNLTPAKNGFYVDHVSSYPVEKVTHWMPLPEPPNDA